MTVYHGGHTVSYTTGQGVSVPAPQPHPVSRGVVVALAAYAAMATWAVYEGLRGVPNRAGVGLYTEPLGPTRNAALWHAGVVLWAQFLGRSLWSGKPGGGGGSTHCTTAIQPPGVLHAVVWTIVSLAVGTLFWTTIAVAFGVSALFKLRQTAHVGLLLASFTFVPGAALYGCTRR